MPRHRAAVEQSAAACPRPLAERVCDGALCHDCRIRAAPVPVAVVQVQVPEQAGCLGEVLGPELADASGRHVHVGDQDGVPLVREHPEEEDLGAVRHACGLQLGQALDLEPLPHVGRHPASLALLFALPRSGLECVPRQPQGVGVPSGREPRLLQEEQVRVLLLRQAPQLVQVALQSLHVQLDDAQGPLRSLVRAPARGLILAFLLPLPLGLSRLLSYALVILPGRHGTIPTGLEPRLPRRVAGVHLGAVRGRRPVAFFSHSRDATPDLLQDCPARRHGHLQLACRPLAHVDGTFRVHKSMTGVGDVRADGERRRGREDLCQL